MIKILWSDSTWFFDIDDTLIDTAGVSISASEGVRKVFSEEYTEQQAKQVQNNFNDIFQIMMTGYRVKNDDEWQQVAGGKAAFDKILENIENHQIRVKQKFGVIKKWSREVLVKLASDKANLNITPELVRKAADAYWLTLTEQTVVFSHVPELMQTIKKYNRPIYLLTSSDGRLRMDEGGQFDYDPQYSETFKRRRIELLRKKGIFFNALSIGDPEDKPHLDFFLKGLKIAEEDLGYAINTKHAIMVGDSFEGDLQVPKEQIGFGLVVLFQKDRMKTEIVDEHQIITGNLSEVVNFLI